MNKKIAIISIICFVVDQISKIIIVSKFDLNEVIVVIKNFFNLTYVENTGAAWSILTKNTHLLILIGLFACLIVIRYMNSFKHNKRNTIAFGLLMGGICGNLLDRIVRGYVVDFLSFKIFNYDFPVFNISDMAIFFGVVLLIIAIVKGEDNEVRSK